MTASILRISLSAALASLAATMAFAQVKSVPKGAVVTVIAGGTVSTPSVTPISIPLSDDVPAGFVGASAGRIAAVTSNTITVTGAGWTASSLNVLGSPYFVRIMSGSAVGRTLLITANTTDTLTVNNQGTDLTTLGITVGASGDRFELMAGDTLSSLFGTSGTFAIGSSSLAGADYIQIFDTATNSWGNFWYNSTAGQWRRGSTPTSQNNFVIRPDTGMLYFRKGPEVSFTMLGTVPSTDIKVVVPNSGTAVVGSVFPVSTSSTLGTLALNTNIPGWVVNTGTNLATSDKVQIFEVSTKTWAGFNYRSDVSQWRRGSTPTNQNAYGIAAGVPIILTRPGSTPGVVVYNYVKPYTL